MICCGIQEGGQGFEAKGSPDSQEGWAFRLHGRMSHGFDGLCILALVAVETLEACEILKNPARHVLAASPRPAGG
jgi:hypothetical protein